MNDQSVDIDNTLYSKVEELAACFGVFLMTAGRDLQTLEDRGLIGRHHH